MDGSRPTLRETPEHLSVWNRNRARTRRPGSRLVQLAIAMGRPRSCPSARDATATGRNSGDGLPHGRQPWEARHCISAIRSLAPGLERTGPGSSRSEARVAEVQGRRHHISPLRPSARTRAMGSDSAAGRPARGAEPHSARLSAAGLHRCVNGPGRPHGAAPMCPGIAAEGPEATSVRALGARSRQSPSHRWPCLGAPNGASSDSLQRGHPAVGRPGP